MQLFHSDWIPTELCFLSLAQFDPQDNVSAQRFMGSLMARQTDKEKKAPAGQFFAKRGSVKQLSIGKVRTSFDALFIFFRQTTSLLQRAVLC